VSRHSRALLPPPLACPKEQCRHLVLYLFPAPPPVRRRLRSLRRFCIPPDIPFEDLPFRSVCAFSSGRKRFWTLFLRFSEPVDRLALPVCPPQDLSPITPAIAPSAPWCQFFHELAPARLLTDSSSSGTFLGFRRKVGRCTALFLLFSIAAPFTRWCASSTQSAPSGFAFGSVPLARVYTKFSLPLFYELLNALTLFLERFVRLRLCKSFGKPVRLALIEILPRPYVSMGMPPAFLLSFW